ncbi:MAG: ABC transporter substrate-binding protein [Clostridia bacterium]|nr:ABC transporter substrate-binding protein [Clostridia bacterium]MBQ6172461.1 ABC transporter substrate-binding protein [Clostridia bacterium]
MKKFNLKAISMLLAVVMLLTVFAACSNNDSKPENNDNATEQSQQNEQTEENYDGKLVFDHSMELKYAKCFSVDYYKGGYKLIKLVDDSAILVVPEGMSVPADKPENAVVLQQPVSNILVSSTPVTSLINSIGALDSISLTTYDADSWYIDDVKQAILDGKITYIGDYKAPDYEMITAAGTTFAFFSTMLTDDVKEQLQNIGVDVILDQSAQEDHPLARVEWAKLYGAIFNKEDNAETVFNTQANYVDELSKLEKTGKTVAMFYITSKGVLYARNADDYMAKMIALAGGDYVLSDVGVGETGTVKMEMEAFFDKAKDADYIVYIWSMGGKPETLAAFTERAEILGDMKAVKEGNVWCTTPDYFQIQNTIGSMINDIRLMMDADASTDNLTYLFRLK